MIKSITILFLFSVLHYTGLCQESRIAEDTSLVRVLNNFQYLNTNPEYTMDGWKILVTVSRDRRKVEREKRNFDEFFPELDAKMVFEDPYYKIFCCAFRTKGEMRGTLAKIREEFNGAFEVAAKVTNVELYQTLKVRLE